MSLLPAFVGALCVILGLAMFGNRAGYFYLVIRPRSLVTMAVIATVGGWFLSGEQAPAYLGSTVTALSTHK
jgi:hypothetical protein